VIPTFLPSNMKLFDVNFDVYRIAREKSDEFEAGSREWMFERFLGSSESSNSTRAFIVHGTNEHILDSVKLLPKGASSESGCEASKIKESIHVVANYIIRWCKTRGVAL